MLRVLLAFALALPLAAGESRAKAIQDATALVDARKFDEAIAALTKLAADDPSDSVAVYELALAYAAKGDNEQCVARLEPIAKAPGAHQVGAISMLGNCLDQLGRKDKAIETYRRGLELAPDDWGLLFNLAITLVQSGKTDEGRELLKRDVEKNPAHASGHYVLGQVFEAQNFRFPAAMSFLHFLAIEPTSQRSATAASHLQKLVGVGVEKTKKGTNITINTSSRKEEGDYSGMEMMLAIVAGGSMIPEEAKKSEFERVQGQVGSVIAIFLESKGEGHDDFTERVQRPFFEAMEHAKMVDTFAGAALISLRLPGSVEWAKKHEKDLDAYLAWIRPRLMRPAVALPPH
jgi:tetratricopeptide (TPR) repeat protein